MLRIALIVIISTQAWGSISLPKHLEKNSIAIQLQKKLSKVEANQLKKKVLKQGKESVRALTYIMRNKKYPIESRWMATFLLGQVAGKSSVDFISRFSNHPEWMMRLASLKTVSILGDRSAKFYSKLLDDKSMIVRFQSLEAIKRLKIKELGSKVWKMVFDKKNYIQNKGFTKRSEIVSKAIEVVGALDYKRAKKPLLKMIKSDRYSDVFFQLDSSLSKLLNKKSPKGLAQKKVFWKSVSL